MLPCDGVFIIFWDTLGIEINEGYINLGVRRRGRLLGLKQTEAPVSDGQILDPGAFTEILGNYLSANKPGKGVLMTVKTSKALLRFCDGKDKDEVFPMDTRDYALDSRVLEDGRLLMCGIPKCISDGFSDVIAGMGLVPLSLDLYENSLSLALENSGGNSLCVIPSANGLGLVYVEGGRLKELAVLDNGAELEIFLGGLHGTRLDRWYNLTTDSRVDEALTQAGALDIAHTSRLPLVGLLWGKRNEKHKSINGRISDKIGDL